MAVSERTTMRDVARRAGVSPATVSNVVNGRLDQVSPQTAQVVRRVLAELGYGSHRPMRSQAAASRHERIGVVISGLDSDLFTLVLNGVESVTTRFGYGLLVSNSAGIEAQELPALQLLLSQGVDGVIFILNTAFSQAEAVKAAHDAGVPAIVVNRLTNPDWAFHLFVDNEYGGYRATEHLVELGHTRIGCLHLPIEGPRVKTAGIDRLRGYHKALEDYGLASREAWVQPGLFGNAPEAATSGFTGMNAILQCEERPTGVVCGSDALAIGALHAAVARGIRVPYELAVVGHDDTAAAALTTPPLTSVKLPMEKAGMQAAETLINAIWKGRSLSGMERMTSEIVVRASTHVFVGEKYLVEEGLLGANEI